MEGALGRYELRPTVNLVQSSTSLDTILLQCAANDPAVARAFVVALRDNYIVETRERIRVILNSTRDFFRSELARLQREVVASETGLRADFDEFPGLDPADLSNVGNRLETLRTERASVQQRRAELEAQIAARERFLVSAPGFYGGATGGPTTQPGVVETTALHPADGLLEDGIEAVKAQIVQMVTARRMTMEHPEVKRLVGRLEGLEELRRTLAEALPETPASPASQPALVRGGTNREWQTQQMRIELELDALRRQLAITAEQWEEVDARAAKLGGLYERLMQNGDELRRLRETRTGRTAEISLWQSHLASLERVLTAESGERGTQFSLIEEPKDGSVPTKPRVSAVFMVCFGVGLAAAALAVALAELFDRSFRSAGQVARTLGIPVLECVGVIPTPQVRRRAVRAFGLDADAGRARASAGGQRGVGVCELGAARRLPAHGPRSGAGVERDRNRTGRCARRSGDMRCRPWAR